WKKPYFVLLNDAHSTTKKPTTFSRKSRLQRKKSCSPHHQLQ
ncbi:unnamed protein product, partial [Brassica rapa subsp. trilocularis]